MYARTGMMNNEISRQSLGVQSKKEEYLKTADTHFSLEWLRKLVWNDLRTDLKASKCTEYCRNVKKDPWRRFVLDYLRTYQSNLGCYLEMSKALFDGEDFVLTLIDERADLIDKFVSMKVSSWWKNVQQDDNGDSLRKFASRLYTLSEEDQRAFFDIIDHLGITTDLICRRDYLYGMKLNYVSSAKRLEEQRKGENDDNKLTKERLRKAVDACKDLFWAQTAWAVVYAVCVEDWGFEKNKANFERYVQTLKVHIDYGCPTGTLDSAEASSPFFKLPTDQWHENTSSQRVFRLLEKLRSELSKA